MKTLLNTFARPALVVAALAAATSSGHAQLSLPAGGSVTPPGVSYPATIVYDNLVNVEVRNSGGALMYQGKLLDRVTRNAAGVLEFRSQLRDVTPGFNGIASSIDRLNMAPYTTSVSFDPTSAGTVSPFLASRTAAPGTTVKWRYPTTVSSSATTKFAAITTNATSYNTRGVAVVTLQTGDSVILTGIAQPGAGSPRASITGPAPLSCDCNPITITGTADADGSMASYTLEYSTSPTGPWNTIVTSTTPVTGGTLASWNTSGIPTGNYFVRLRVSNTDGISESAVTHLHVDSSPPGISLRSPLVNQLVGGVICLDGTVDDDACFSNYRIAYQRPGGVKTYVSTSTTEVFNDPLGSINAGGFADGPCTIFVEAIDTCGQASAVSRNVVIDNTRPVAQIASPLNCDTVRGLVAIRGTAFDANISGWSLSVTGGPYNTSVPIASGSTNITDGVLGLWDTSDLPACSYTLRLRVDDRSSVNCGSSNNATEYYVSVEVGDPFCGADVNEDGGVDSSDVDAFFEVWERGGC
jgi:hypothetical protein